jgi:hypothetical protein
MGLLKGNAAITRYRVVEPLTGDFTHEFIAKRLKKFCFADIDATNDESAAGWVELFDWLGADFPLDSFVYGRNYAFTMRLDSRKLSSKILNRYYAIAELQFEEKHGRRPNARKKKDLKENLRLQLLKKTLVTTDLYETVWFPKTSEVWFFGNGEKLRNAFEDLFSATFGLTLRLIVPITMGIELIDKDKRLSLLDVQSSLLDSEE